MNDSSFAYCHICGTCASMQSDMGAKLANFLMVFSLLP